MTKKKEKLDEHWVDYNIVQLETALLKDLEELDMCRSRFTDKPADVVNVIGIQDLIRNISNLVIMIKTAKATKEWMRGRF